MIRVNHCKRENGEVIWRMAWLVTILASPHTSSGAVAIIAFDNKHSRSSWDDGQGLELRDVPLHEIRIVRSMIPLLSDAMARGVPLPDGAKGDGAVALPPR